MLKYCSFKRCSPILISYEKLAYFRKIIAVVVSKIDPLRLKSCQIMASFGSANGLWISWCLLGCAKVLSDAPLDSREAGARLIKNGSGPASGSKYPAQPGCERPNDGWEFIVFGLQVWREPGKKAKERGIQDWANWAMIFRKVPTHIVGS